MNRPNSSLFLKGLFALLFIPFSTSLKAQLTIDAQYRNRFELRQGYQKLASEGQNAAAFISQRTRISFTYKTDGLLLKFAPQDVRIWGDEQHASNTGVFGDQASLDLFEAYAELQLGKRSSVTVGRQPLVYDNQRILAARNWNQYGLSYDAVLLKWEPTDWRLHFAGSWNASAESLADIHYDPDRIKTLLFVWAGYQKNENLKFSFSHQASGQTASDTENKLYFRQTPGLFTQVKFGNWKLTANGYYQFGRSNRDQKVDAFLVDVEAQSRFGKWTSGAGGSFLSGNKHTGDARTSDHLFDVLYGARHSFFGAMDYFRNFRSNTNDGGLSASYVFVDWKPSPKTSLKNTVWYFWLATTNEQTPDRKALGFENDLVVKHRFREWAEIEGGWLFSLPTDQLKAIQSVGRNQFSYFLYLQLNVSTRLFSEVVHI